MFKGGPVRRARGGSARTLLLATAVPASLLMSSAVLADEVADPSTPGAPASAGASCDPYTTYSCLDGYLGTGFFERLANYYALEWGQAAAPSDPNAPASRRDDWPATPQSNPPMPFTEWPYGGATALGVTRPNSVDSPLMVALGNTAPGEWLQDHNFQLYGWVNAGFNVSSNTVRPGGNAPIAYAYTPNTVQLDQVVLYLDRFPDTVQTDHIDWGMRLSAIYGENYRYTTSYGIASYQLLKKNNVNGYDFPMLYGELYIPQVAQGLMLRAGRYISLPDIEAQLAPNNYMYTHSMTYTFDNYTNEGVQATLAATKNLFLQLGVSIGTEAPFWHWGERVKNPAPNPLYPGNTFLKDPGAKPSLTGCVRYTTDSGNDNVYACANGINNGVWGYNNLQWYGVTYYHKFNDKWHLSWEIYDLHQNGVPNLNNPTAMAAYNAGGTPFSPQYMPYNAPGLANCSNPNALTCRATAIGTVAYLNYQITPRDNISFRPEFFDDQQGQRTGTKAQYFNLGIGWQHWWSPQVEIRPEIDWDRSLGVNAFNGNANAGIAPDRKYTVMGAMDVILHF
ncbi:outer membrane beta-barrel protein [Nitrospirillum sp. BR 11752]|uniref:outer membrane beta-barrel protein n=1 Tax=Nitrospirillum sp. BR 11752 TaxID=3104293 RepID=UPI002EA62BEC|nr:outer membrane beta-barrel protein [Nitrospirillum sp. BR 11752]